MEYLFCYSYCITYSNIGLYHKIALFFALLTTWIPTWCFCYDHLDDATFTFISTVAIAVTCSLYPAIHAISLLLTQPYRPTLDTCFQIPFYYSLVYMHPQYMIFYLNLMLPSQSKCSDPNNESDPSSEYSPLGLTHVMNQYLGQKFTTWVKINCLDTILKPHNGIPRPCTVHE